MKTLQYFLEPLQRKTFAECGAFFAFGEEQLKTNIRKGVRYYSLGNGLYVPQCNDQYLRDKLDADYEKAANDSVTANGAVAIIEHEYFNHETQITMDSSYAYSALLGYRKMFPDMFTDELIAEVFNNCFKLAVKNDWF